LTEPIPLRLGRHRPAQDLEIQLLDSEPLRERFQDAEPVIGGVNEPAISIPKDEGLGRTVFALQLPTSEFGCQAARKVDLSQTSGRLPAGPDLSSVDGLGDRQGVLVIERTPAQGKKFAQTKCPGHIQQEQEPVTPGGFCQDHPHLVAIQDPLRR
jgi:hypothetical protein